MTALREAIERYRRQLVTEYSGQARSNAYAYAMLACADAIGGMLATTRGESEVGVDLYRDGFNAGVQHANLVVDALLRERHEIREWRRAWVEGNPVQPVDASALDAILARHTFDPSFDTLAAWPELKQSKRASHDR